MPNKRKERPYISVNVPREWEKHLNDALETPEVLKGLELSGKDRKASSLGVWIIEQWLINHTQFRFEHFNTFENYATIKDKKFPNSLFDIYPKEEGTLWCENCDSTECDHVKYALTVPEIIEPLRKKGWKHTGEEGER